MNDNMGSVEFKSEDIERKPGTEYFVKTRRRVGFADFLKKLNAVNPGNNPTAMHPNPPQFTGSHDLPDGVDTRVLS